MQRFIEKHQSKLQGVLSCFDRVLFRGYLTIFNGYGPDWNGTATGVFPGTPRPVAGFVP